MKKLIAILTVVLLTMTIFAGCAKDETTESTAAVSGDTTETTQAVTEQTTVKAPEDTMVALAISTTQNDFMALVEEQLGQRFITAGYQWESASADGSAQRQIEQIENFITMGADEIIIMAVEPTSLTDVCQKAIDQGVKIYAFTMNTGVYSAFMGSDEAKVGEAIANLGSKWVDEAFPDAAEGTVNTVIFSYSGSPEAAERSEALYSIAEMNPKIKIVNTVEMLNTTDAGQQATENLAQTNPETNLILCYNGAMAVGVNASVMSPGSPFEDKEHFGVFGSELTEEVIQNIMMSETNESVFRGTAQLGGDIMVAFDNILANSQKMLNGEEYLVDDYAQVDEINVHNLKDFVH